MRFVLLPLAAACGSREPIRIGIVLDGDGIHGATLAAADINASGGIDGRALELRLAGGQTDNLARNALAPAESLAADLSILAVVGHTNSAASLSAARIYNANRVVQIAPTSTAPMYSHAGPYSFRMVASDRHQADFLGRAAISPSPRRIAILYVNDDYGRGLRNEVVRYLKTHGVVPVYEAPYSEGTRFTGIEGVASAIVASRPQVLLWLGRAPELILLLPEVRARSSGIAVLASDGFGRPPAGDLAIAVQGVRYVRLLDPGNSREAVQRLRSEYEKRWQRELTDQYLLAYQAVQVLAEAIRTSGPDREAIRTYLSGLGSTRAPFDGMLGPISFDANGDAPGQYFLLEVPPADSNLVANGVASASP
ncbi:MAG: branched-chain amino acid ABC transporter substrate-binding protein [Gemmatimonadaceae bacterium]